MSRAWDELNDIEQDDLVYTATRGDGWEDVYNNHRIGILCREEAGASAYLDADPEFAAMRVEIERAQSNVDAMKDAYGRAVARRLEDDIRRVIAERDARS